MKKEILSPAQDGYSGFATLKATSFSLRWMKIISEIILTCMVSERRSLISSKYYNHY